MKKALINNMKERKRRSRPRKYSAELMKYGSNKLHVMLKTCFKVINREDTYTTRIGIFTTYTIKKKGFKVQVRKLLGRILIICALSRLFTKALRNKVEVVLTPKKLE